MCGRFAFYSPAEATASLFGARGTIDVTPRYNIAPTQFIAGVRNDEDGDRELTTFRWGLVPFWAKDPSIGNRMINARAETIAEKPSFRTAYRKRRCLILADGFYEWHTEDGVKLPYYISLASGEPFAFAGLWEHWDSKQTDESLETATIVTTGANDFLSRLHHRMPVVLEPSTAERWMDGDTTLLDDFTDSAPALRAWPVARTVNNARNESPDLIDPDGDPVS
jgi:putative SOS response-associated peptidase YedK